MPDLHGFDPLAAARLVVAIGAYRTLHGTGPGWRQAARAAGWTWTDVRARPGVPARSEDLAERMHALRRARLLTFTREPNSLDLAPGAAAWALRTLEQARRKVA